ncbi:MAG: carbohydrate kinase family protein, partial [Desulfomonilaceae bacterium]
GKIDLAEIGLSSHLRIKRTQLPSGRCLALINTKDRQRDRSLVIVPNANDLVNTDASDLGYFCNANWVHFTSFVSNGPLEAQGKVLQNLPDDVNVSFDPGAVYCGLGIKHLEHMVARCQVLFLTKEELFTLMGLGSIEKAVSRLISIGAKTIILKLGAKGIMAFQSNNTSFQEAVPPTYVVDRTGAGDVAAAGLLAGLILGLPLIDCLGLAVRAASRSIEGYGRLKYPDRKFLKDFLTELNGKFFS